METNYCHRLLVLILKLLHFLQFFLGISTAIYSAYLLHQWLTQPPFIPSPSPPLPPAPGPDPGPGPGPGPVSDYLVYVSSVRGLDFGSGLGSDLLVYLNSVQLPAPWFIYFLMVIGLLLCFMSCIGHIAAEVINGCCLCFYMVLTLLLMVLEASLVAFIAIDQHWEKDLPYDPTGELEKLKSFIEENADICKWVGIVLLIAQALSILLSLVLRAMISTAREDSDIENDYVVSSNRVREPLLNSRSQSNPSSPLKGEGRGSVSDIWSTRIRQKYGLNNESSKSPPLDQNGSPSTNP